MTEGPEPVPGQLGIVPDAAELDDAHAEARATLERLDLAREQYKASALERARSLAAALTDAGVALDRAVAEAKALGATWAQIAEATGLSKSAAHERWANR